MSESDGESLNRNQKVLNQKLLSDADKFNKCKKLLGEKEERLQQQKHFVEEILEWERRLEVEENRLKEMKKKALSAALKSPGKKEKTTKKVSLKVEEASCTSKVKF